MMSYMPLRKRLLTIVTWLSSAVLLLFKDALLGRAGDALMGALPQSISNAVVSDVLLYLPPLVLIILGICIFKGWGTDITVHWTRPFLRRFKGSSLDSPNDHWTERRQLEISILANVSAGLDPYHSPIDSDPALSRLRELKDAILTNEIDASLNGEHPNVMSTITLREFELYVSATNKPYWVEVLHRWQSRHSKEVSSEAVSKSKRIRLSDATVTAYEQTILTTIARAAEQIGTDIEGWYAAAITKDGDVSVYGRRPPSRIHVEIPSTEVQQMFFEDNANVLQDAFDPNRKYVDLEVDEDEFLKRLQAIKEWEADG